MRRFNSLTKCVKPIEITFRFSFFLLVNGSRGEGFFCLTNGTRKRKKHIDGNSKKNEVFSSLIQFLYPMCNINRNNKFLGLVVKWVPQEKASRGNQNTCGFSLIQFLYQLCTVAVWPKRGIYFRLRRLVIFGCNDNVFKVLCKLGQVLPWYR
jgi:hypothetical protein